MQCENYVKNVWHLLQGEIVMYKLYIWGLGAARKMIADIFIDGTYELLGYIDNNPRLYGSRLDGVPIKPIRELQGEEYDYIIASMREYEPVVYQYAKSNLPLEKLICFFKEEDLQRFADVSMLDINKWKVYLLQEKVKKLELKLNNAKYEIVDKYSRNDFFYPIIGSTEEAIHKIVTHGCSLLRFGDGEFEIMAGRNRAPFQQYTSELAVHLKDVLHDSSDKLLMCIAPNYGWLGGYSESIADGIRAYMTNEVRKEHKNFLRADRVYYDAYMFKVYMPYKDKRKTQERFNLISKIWEKRDVVLIEGEQTRTGYGNDLLAKARSVQRILAPTKNAFDKYEEILEAAMVVPKDKLILLVLGPAGKVLGYDLFKHGYQVVDIGQIDMDYDWYKAGTGYRIGNPYKYVSQLAECDILKVCDSSYVNQIIACIR